MRAHPPAIPPFKFSAPWTCEKKNKGYSKIGQNGARRAAHDARMAAKGAFSGEAIAVPVDVMHDCRVVVARWPGSAQRVSGIYACIAIVLRNIFTTKTEQHAADKAYHVTARKLFELGNAGETHVM